MKTKLMFLLVFCTIHLCYGQNYKTQLSKLQNIDYNAFVGKPLSVFLNNDTIKKYKSIRTAQYYEKPNCLNYIIFRYTKGELFRDCPLLKVYLKTEKDIIILSSLKSPRIFSDYLVERIVLYSPEESLQNLSFTTKNEYIGISAAKKVIMEMDTSFFKSCIDLPLSTLLQRKDKLFYNSYDITSAYNHSSIVFYYSWGAYVEVYFDKKKSPKSYLYKDFFGLWNLKHFENEVITEIHLMANDRESYYKVIKK